MKKYIVVEVIEREIGTPRIYNTFEEASEDMCDSFAQVKGYDTWDDFAKDYPDADKDDYQTDDWGIYNDMAYAQTANHSDWDIQIFTMDI